MEDMYKYIFGILGVTSTTLAVYNILNNKDIFKLSTTSDISTLAQHQGSATVPLTIVAQPEEALKPHPCNYTIYEGGGRG